MKITILSNYALIVDLAMKLQEEGNEVKIYCKKDSEVGKGLVPTQHGIGGLNADLILIDDVGFGGVADGLRKKGKAVFGGSVVTDRLENDREFGMEIMEASGIKVPAYKEFTNFSNGIEYVKANKTKRFVFKPYGQKSRSLTHVGKDSEEMIAMMEHFKKAWPENSSIHFILQDFVEGIEMAIGGWFNGSKFARPIMPNFEHKKLFRGDIGPNTGEMGTVLCYRMKNKLFTETLQKAEAFLKTTGYAGYLDINCIVTPTGAYGLEWTSRLGSPTIQIQDEVHRKGSWGTFLYKLALGLTEDVPADTSKWDVGVALCALPWPLVNKSDMFRDTPVFMPESLDHIHLAEVWKDGEQYRQAGGETGYICLVTGSDVDMRKAQDKAYKLMETINVPGGFWRDDIGDKVMADFSKLQAQGWIK